jgi:short-subunit dehydrogenase
MMNVNFWGYINFVHAALPHLKNAKGSIGVMSSVSGLVGVPFRTAYCASKFAVMGFFNALRQELANEVKISILCPGWIDSGLNSRHVIEEQTHYSGSKMPVDTAVEIILYTIASGKREEKFVLKNKAAPILQAIIPEIVDWFVSSHVKK